MLASHGCPDIGTVYGVVWCKKIALSHHEEARIPVLSWTCKLQCVCNLLFGCAEGSSLITFKQVMNRKKWYKQEEGIDHFLRPTELFGGLKADNINLFPGPENK